MYHLEAVGCIIKSTTSSIETKNKIYKKCSYEICNQPFKTEKMFRHHLVTSHPYPLRCPYNSECNKLVSNGNGYLGLMELKLHIEAKHSAQFPEPMCFHGRCQQDKHFKDWEKLMNHILVEHWLDVRLN